MTGFVSVVMALRSAPEGIEGYLSDLSEKLSLSFPHFEVILVANQMSPEDLAELKGTVHRLDGLELFVLGNPVNDHIATTAGLDQLIGDIAVIAEAIVDPPEAIVRAARAVGDGVDVVYGIDTNRQENRRFSAYSLAARVFGWAYSRLSGFVLPVAASGLRALSREVLTDWLQNLDRHRLLQVMPALSGHRYEVIEYGGNPLSTRRSSVLRSIRYGLATILRSSATPIRLATGLALLAALGSFLYALYVVLIATIRGDVVEGWTSLSLIISALFLLVSVVLAILAEYVYQLVVRLHDRPLYRIAEEVTSPGFSSHRRPNVEEPGFPIQAAGGSSLSRVPEDPEAEHQERR